MSATVLYQPANGKAHKELHPTEQEALQALKKTIEKHRAKGHNVSEQPITQGLHLCYTVKDSDGRLIGTYQVVA